MKKVLIVYLLLILGFTMNVFAQDLAQIGVKKILKKKPKVTGGFGINQSLYFSDGPSRFNPYNYAISGNIVFSAWGLTVPVSFAYNNQKFSYAAQQPFNIIGLSPTYKNFTAHIGYRNLSYSAYTLSGHAFLGGGVEYKGKLLNVAAMGGRFMKAVNYDSSNANIKPAYERWGSALKLGFTKGGDDISIIAFYAKDKENSIKPIIQNNEIAPQENLVYSLNLKKGLSKNVSIQAEGAVSSWTRDTRFAEITESKKPLENLFFTPIRQTTNFYKAFKTSLNVNMKVFQWGLAFEHVDPEYRTLGAYYFNNDFQNLTLNASTKFFKDKVSLSGSIGKQRDDLKNVKMSQMKRTVGSLNTSIKFTEKLNMSIAYSNFSSFTLVKPVDRTFLANTQYAQIDTLNFVQVNQSINTSLTYKLLSNDNVTHGMTASANYQTASNKQGSKEKVNDLMGATIGFNSAMKKTGFNIGININSNLNKYDLGNALFIGTGINSSLPLFKKKLNVSLNGNVANNYESGTIKARLFAVTNSYSIKIKKHHSLSASARYTGRAKIGEASLAAYNTAFNELFASLGYQFSF